MPLQRQLLGAAAQLLKCQQQASSTAGCAAGLQQVPGCWRAAQGPTGVRLYAAAEQAMAAPAAGLGRAAAGGAQLRALLRDYKQLSKFKLSALVVATAGAGFVAGSGQRIDWGKLGWTALGTMGCAASANTLNQWYEVQRDALMMRTRNRPLPQGRMSPRHALAFAFATGLGGASILYWQTNATTAALGAANIGLYAGVYTPLKVISISNTWVGAVVGAIPPLMGWAAASGSLDLGSAALASVLYFWQLPHFLSLAWLCRGDYAKGGYRMMSLVDATGKRTAACCLRNSLYLLPAGLLAYQLGVASSWLATEAGIMAGIMAITAARFYRNPTNTTAKGLFRASLLYLPVFMVGLIVHRTPDRRQQLAGAQQVEADCTADSDAHSSGSDGSGRRPAREAEPVFRPPFAAPFPLLPLPNRDMPR